MLYKLTYYAFDIDEQKMRILVIEVTQSFSIFLV